MKRIKAIYPGSFDPPTNGHFDLIERGSKIFDELVVAILRNPDKDPLFSVADRRKMLEELKELEELESVEDSDDASFRGIVYLIYSSILSRSLNHSCRANIG